MDSNYQEKTRRLHFVKNHEVVLEHFRNEFLKVIKSRALEMSEINISEHSQKSSISEAVRILIKNSEVKNGDEWKFFLDFIIEDDELYQNSLNFEVLKIRCGKNLRTDFIL